MTLGFMRPDLLQIYSHIFSVSPKVIQILLSKSYVQYKQSQTFSLAYTLCLGLPGGAGGKESVCRCRQHERHRLEPWVWKVPWRRAWQPTPVLLTGESHGQRSLAGYSPQGHKKLDITKATQHAHTLLLVVFSDGSMVKNPPANAGDTVLNRVGKIPWRREWQPTLAFLPGKSQGLRILGGYSPGGCKESDTTEQLNMHVCIPLQL